MNKIYIFILAPLFFKGTIIASFETGSMVACGQKEICIKPGSLADEHLLAAIIDFERKNLDNRGLEAIIDGTINSPKMNQVSADLQKIGNNLTYALRNIGARKFGNGALVIPKPKSQQLARNN